MAVSCVVTCRICAVTVDRATPILHCKNESKGLSWLEKAWTAPLAERSEMQLALKSDVARMVPENLGQQ